MPISGRSLPSKRRSGWPAKPHFPANISMTRHGAAGFYRVWRSHPFFGTAAVGAGQSPSISVLAPASDCSLAPNPPDGRHAPAEISPPAPCLARHPRLELAPTERRITIRRGTRRGGRVVECTALEMRHRCKPIGGSNPSLSATPSKNSSKTANLLKSKGFPHHRRYTRSVHRWSRRSALRSGIR